MKYKVCCCSGHRPNGFLDNYDDKENKRNQEYLKLLEYILNRDISQKGFNYFISGGALGVDMDFAETVIKLRDEYPHIQLEIAVPCVNQDLKWRKEDKERYQNILKKANSVNVISPAYTPWCMDKRNRYMVDKAEKVLIVWNASQKGGTYNTMKYAYKKDKYMEFIMLPALNENDFYKQIDYYIEYSCSVEDRKKKDEAMERCLEKLKLNTRFTVLD